jgi:hypothetical protein
VINDVILGCKVECGKHRAQLDAHKLGNGTRLALVHATLDEPHAKPLQNLFPRRILVTKEKQMPKKLKGRRQTTSFQSTLCGRSNQCHLLELASHVSH